MSDHDSAGVRPTNEQLIRKVIGSLENDEKTDTALLNVIFEYIARLDPKETAVSDAVRDIEGLVEKRVEESAGGSADHD